MNRCLKLSVLAALALGSTQALALDLGQIQVKSALDRPLVADIPLTPEYPGEADHVTVTLAPAAAFARAGISRANLNVPLTFQVLTNDRGQKVIRVTSTQPVREPYLDFLIQVTWPKGKLLREYTVLLDPLSMTSAPGAVPAPVQAPAPAPAPAAAPTPAPAPAPAEPTQTAASSHSVQEDVYGPVQYGDTLSHIARTNAVAGVSYQQMLIALKAANPDAFFRDNVNALKSGAVLRIPTRVQARDVTRKAAIAAVRKQNLAWQGRHASAPTLVAGAGGTASSSASNAGQADASNDLLHLVPPKAGDGTSAGVAAGGGQATVRELRQDLVRSKEALSSQKQSATELKSRLSALEGIADKNKRLLSLKNSEIAALQDKLSEARDAAGLPAQPASVLGAGVVTASSSATAMLASSVSAGTSTDLPMASASASNPAMPGVTSTAAAADVAAVTPAQDHAAVTTTPLKTDAAQPAASTGAPWYETLWAKVALGVIIVLLIVWALLRRRKASGKPTKASLADHFGDSPFGHAADGAEPDATDAAEASEQDDDGESELLAQLAGHPDNIGLHLELVSLYYARRDADQFEAAAEAMHAYVDDTDQPEWQDALAMGRDLAPDHPLFAASAAQADTYADEAPLEEPFPATDAGHEAFDHPAEDVQERAPATDENATEIRSDGYSFDFDLSSEPSAPAQESTDADAPATGLPDESEFDALPPLPSEAQDAREDSLSIDDEPTAPEPAPTPTPAFDADTSDDPAGDFAQGGFSDDPVDTKLDLARAYMDMGDHDGARAMLTEALHEGTQTQQDAAQKLLDELG